MTRLLNDLLPVNSLVMLLDPHLSKCTIDGQLSVRCDAPNLHLILVERTRKRLVVDKLEELRDRGNQAYIQGDTQLALDYYTFAINRLTVMAGMVASEGTTSMSLYPLPTVLFGPCRQRGSPGFIPSGVSSGLLSFTCESCCLLFT